MLLTKINDLILLCDYHIGNTLARLIVKKIGAGCMLHRRIKFISPGNIEIGNSCEIENGVVLDARSNGNQCICLKIKEKCRIKDHVNLMCYGGSIHIDKSVLIGRLTTVFGHGGVTIGSHTMIGPNVSIISSNHIACLSNIPFQDQGFTREKIKIGRNVWIGAHTTILAGSDIENNTVVAAGAIVNRRLKEGWIYGGVPAKPIKPIDSCAPKNVTIYYKDWNMLK